MRRAETLAHPLPPFHSDMPTVSRVKSTCPRFDTPPPAGREVAYTPTMGYQPWDTPHPVIIYVSYAATMMVLVPSCPAADPLWCRAFYRSAVVIIDSRNLPPIGCGGGSGRDPSGAEVGISGEALAESEMAEAKKKLHLLTLQTLKYSTLWIILRVSPSLSRQRACSCVIILYVHPGGRYCS